MLRSVALHDFKSFANASATLAPFTLLVGANGSGKSNFIDALRLLHGLAHGWTLRETLAGKTEGSTRVWPGIRGGTREFVRVGAPMATLTSDWLALGDAYTHTLTADSASVLVEQLENVFAADQRRVGGGVMDVRWLSGSMVQATAPRHDVSAERSVLASVDGLANHWCGVLRTTMAGLRFVEQAPARMRDYVERPPAGLDGVPSSTSDNLSAVLWQLAKTAAQRTEIVDWLTEFCGPEISDFDFEETESGYVMLRVVDRGGNRITARSMSDGTLRFLGLLAHLKSLRGGTGDLVVEDIDHGLHPQRCRLLVDAIAAATEPRLPDGQGPRVIATTHSPDLMDAALRVPHAKVLLCAHVPGAGSVIRDVRSLPGFDEVLQRRDFSYLLNTGWLERAV
jgi:predicted ATPase